ncbi:flagellar basal-body rod protein FlgB [Tamilnaduibacter salinus]|uniref:Flagellar basal body rod protein FlgB n=1 Tax=Tamilnaduibacter salinus TaxID=1484056 RepID=A0A2A2I492_9GAMM|nr:flagellar basal body rod protein FlgB [Tamilnaduibacter salinus]PAV26218.1 flagellar basal body rod protein FlgB [Tamilnaduibacter salinus]PVY75295.1 flagellar basal-body rod protein FlgB [Tamilnaduibacter salinus]
MAISFDKALGIRDDALMLHSRRAEVLANNLANADTPGFKARDIDFRAALRDASASQSGAAMERTHDRHMATGGAMTERAALLYRVPHQPSVDGNTVETQQEQARYTRNAMGFQASFQFLSSTFKGMSEALKGQSQ